VGRHFYGEGSERTREWMEKAVTLLEAGDQPGLRKSLGAMRPKAAWPEKALTDHGAIFRNHGHKMDYPRYKEQGF